MKMTGIPIPLQNIESNLESPSYAYPGDAGVDLRSTDDFVIEPFERILIPTGIALAIPLGYAGFVLPRSGLALKRGLSLVNAPGLIDSNYRGEIKAIAINLDPRNNIHIEKGERIAQLVIMKVEEARFLSVADLDATERGAGGFGSSGV